MTATPRLPAAVRRGIDGDCVVGISDVLTLLGN